MKSIFTVAALTLIFTIPAQAQESDYCLAIRGNGENAAAHWGGLAKLVEQKGSLPSAMAGGSSATVTMFFVDSIAGNPVIANEKDPEKKKQMTALMLKSLPGFVQAMAKQDGLMGAYNFLGELAKNKSDTKAAAQKVLAGAGKLDPQDVQKAFAKYGPLVNPEMLQGLATNPNYFRKEAQKGLEVFGKFDAGTDEKLFFRPGLVDFKYFSVLLGTIADFYAGNTDDETKEAFTKYTSECAGQSMGKQWKDVPADCSDRFNKIVGRYLEKGEFQNKALFGQVGEHIPALPTTSLVSGPGLDNYKEKKAAYMKGEKRDYDHFSVNFDEDVKFGYWGRAGDLAKAEKGLEGDRQAGDFKANKFKALGPANWFEVLAVSPAEPGLANFQPMPVNTSKEKVLAELQKPTLQRWSGLEYRDRVGSAGGWSDLAPTGVLKAMGCPQVGYLTRKGGDTVFGQQVAIKLAGDRDNIPWWLKIKEQNATGWPTEGTGAENTAWNRSSNMANLHSSLQNSLRKADFFYCTDWDNYGVFTGQFWPMVEEAYSIGIDNRKADAGCHGTPLPSASMGADSSDLGGEKDAQ